MQCRPNGTGPQHSILSAVLRPRIWCRAQAKDWAIASPEAWPEKAFKIGTLGLGRGNPQRGSLDVRVACTQGAAAPRLGLSRSSPGGLEVKFPIPSLPGYQTREIFRGQSETVPGL